MQANLTPYKGTLPYEGQAIRKYKKSIAITHRIKHLIESNDFSPIEHHLVATRSLPDYWGDKNPSEWMEVFKWVTPNFGMIIKYEGIDKARVIAASIVKLSELPLSEHHQKMAITFLLSKDGFRGFTIMDLKYCLTLGELGQLTKSFGPLKIQDVTGKDGWFETYFKIRSGMYMQIMDDQKSRPEEVYNGVPCPVDISRATDKLAKKLFVDQKRVERIIEKKKITTDTYVRDHPEESERMLAEWREEFEMQSAVNNLSTWIAIKWNAFLHDL